VPLRADAGRMLPSYRNTVPDERVLHRHELLALGFSPRQLTTAVREGTLIRLRRDCYVRAGSDRALATAVRIGGHLTCVSALGMIDPEVFVFAHDHLHVHADRSASRLRGPGGGTQRWRKHEAGDVRLSRRALTQLPAARHVLAIQDVIGQLVRCLPERELIATLDSLLHRRIVDQPLLREVFAGLPNKYRCVLDKIDGRAESGTESFLRLLLVELGIDFAVQVRIAGVGRVDFMIAGFLIVECDSKAHHEGWEKQRSDRRRDMKAAEQGYCTLRILAEDIFHHPESVRAALLGLLAQHGCA
jgi:very-short-patch-repair endonuclease